MLGLNAIHAQEYSTEQSEWKCDRRDERSTLFHSKRIDADFLLSSIVFCSFRAYKEIVPCSGDRT